MANTAIAPKIAETPIAIIAGYQSQHSCDNRHQRQHQRRNKNFIADAVCIRPCFFFGRNVILGLNHTANRGNDRTGNNQNTDNP